MNVLSAIEDQKVIAIIRNAPPERVVDIVNALYQGGLSVVEITMNSPNALSVIEEVTMEFGNKMVVGAGTVLDAKTADLALDAGAKFILSPNVDKETIQTTKKRGAISIPGAFTPTEIVNAYHYGGDIIKVFPATIGSSYIKDIRGPLPEIPLLPTGGINLKNIKSFLYVGAVACGVGGELVNTKKEVTDSYLKSLKDRAEQFVNAVSKGETINFITKGGGDT